MEYHYTGCSRSRIFYHSIMLCIMTIMAFRASSQAPEWKTFTVDNSGLADNIVFTIAFQDNGTKWIGTNDGLSKFDGSNWTTYRMNNSGLPANIVSCLMLDEADKVWIGTDGVFTTNGGGLAIFDGVNWEVYKPSNSIIPDDWVTSIVTDKGMNKWIGTDNGLVKYDGTNMTILPASYYTYYASVAALDIEGDSVVWIGTGSGLSRYDNGAWTVYHTGSSGLPADNIWEVKIDTLGNKWIGTNGGGLAKFDGTDWTVFNSSNSCLPVNDVTSIAIDKSYTLWLGTWQGGLVSYDGTTWTVYNTSNSLIPSDIIYSVALDKYENKWIGTPSGLAIFNKGGILGVDDKPSGGQEGYPFLLEQNRPNPFTSLTTLSFSLEKQGHVILKVLDCQGNEVARPVNKVMSPGHYDIEWDGSFLPTGIYTCILLVNGVIMVKQMVRF